MKRLLALLLLAPISAFAIHITSADYALSGDQPAGFYIQCGTATLYGSAPLVDTNGTNSDTANPAVAGGLYLYQDMTVVGGYATGATCTVYAQDASGLKSAALPFTIPAGPGAPAGLKLVP